MLMTAVPVPPLVNTTEVGLIAYSALSEAAVAVRLTVPAYPPVEVSVIVEVPVLPGDALEMVMLGTVIVIEPGLVTVIGAVPDEGA
jgi:hypothetical protein